MQCRDVISMICGWLLLLSSLAVLTRHRKIIEPSHVVPSLTSDRRARTSRQVAGIVRRSARHDNTTGDGANVVGQWQWCCEIQPRGDFAVEVPCFSWSPLHIVADSACCLHPKQWTRDARRLAKSGGIYSPSGCSAARWAHHAAHACMEQSAAAGPHGISHVCTTCALHDRQRPLAQL